MRNLTPNSGYRVKVHSENGVSQYAPVSSTAEVFVMTDQLGSYVVLDLTVKTYYTAMIIPENIFAN